MSAAMPASTSTKKVCEMSLNDIAQSMARYSTPVGSKSFIKHKRVLKQATKFHMDKTGIGKNHIFSDTIENIIQMFRSYGLEQNLDKTIDSETADNDTIMIDFAYYNHRKVPSKCTGRKCHSIPRISLQTEQVKEMEWAREYVSGCYASPNCLIWDFSDINFEWAKSIEVDGKSSNASESFMIVPHMFHNRLGALHPKSEKELLPYQERSTDAVLFGSMTGRREEFARKYLDARTNGTLSRYKIEFRWDLAHKVVVEGYSNAKICLVVHSYLAESAGEYHRISDFNRFGCVPIMETFGDKMLVETLSSCAGIKFADLDDIPNAIINELKRMNETSADVLREEQLAIDQWWESGIEWNTFLEQVFGPRATAATK